MRGDCNVMVFVVFTFRSLMSSFSDGRPRTAKTREQGFPDSQFCIVMCLGF